ncbi:YcaO-related McrA-glycine thioamidation protein [Methanothermobacter thermautotrophicus]|uniref:YcaO-related McrA-glycine thioamidation protein n=1 Tax=Methanothermobacter thermautotrophicus TaxID=145262 RepID=UPI0022B88F11|nr:YcaO-related McrA-glycine thioamidation protein [Methanothermobacter thermautotrophicus]WBF05567.1 YcaO-related McrA-glycine thioamidation protein [Methanothermobacter thermautotrophicus]
MFRDIPVRYIGCTHRAVRPSETLKAFGDKLSMIGVTRITEITHLDRIGIPVFSAIRPTAEDGAVSIYAGKGATRTQARASAMMEAFERYSAERKPEDETFTAHPEDCDGLDPESLILPGSTDLKSELEWINAENLTGDEEVPVPANAVFHPYNPPEGCMSLFRSNTNGLASGNAREEAIFHGLMEVIERDAWSLFEARRGPKVEVDCSGTDNDIISGLLEKFHAAGVEVTLVDLTADTGVATVAAVADDTVLRDPALLTMGVGTHLDPEIAVIRALTEVAQSRATQIHGTREDTVRAEFMRRAGYERMKRLNRHWFSEPEDTITLDEMEDLSTRSFRGDLEITLRKLRESGLEDVFYVDLTRDVGVPVVRVIVPGLEVFSVDPERVGRRIRSSI